MADGQATREPTQARAIARNIESLIRCRIAERTQSTVAAEAGMSASAVNRVVSGESGVTLDRIGGFLDALGLRIVDAVDVTVPADELAALRLFAAKGIANG